MGIGWAHGMDEETAEAWGKLTALIHSAFNRGEKTDVAFMLIAYKPEPEPGKELHSLLTSNGDTPEARERGIAILRAKADEMERRPFSTLQPTIAE